MFGSKSVSNSPASTVRHGARCCALGDLKLGPVRLTLVGLTQMGTVSAGEASQAETRQQGLAVSPEPIRTRLESPGARRTRKRSSSGPKPGGRPMDAFWTVGAYMLRVRAARRCLSRAQSQWRSSRAVSCWMPPSPSPERLR
jgi:hypothetical protein